MSGMSTPSDPAAENRRSLKPFILILAGVVVTGAAIAIVYKLQEPAPQSMSFRVDDALRGTVNATVLDTENLRGEALLKAHLDVAVESGRSDEGMALRVDELRRALTQVTRDDGPTWYVVWKERLVAITASGG